MDYNAFEGGHVDVDDFLGSVIVSRPLVPGAGGDFRLPGLGLVIDGSQGNTFWAATYEVLRAPTALDIALAAAQADPFHLLKCAVQLAHHGCEVSEPKGLAVSSALFVKSSVVAEMLPPEGYETRVVQRVPRDRTTRGVAHWRVGGRA